ncbi:MAG: 30S ribosome-binding factor RbfA [Clostridiales bacterium]|nr:30S ribosome-binding factor RbfA [Bacillota bacterium]MEE0516579.1 30S ribosome-binding factor RbfA [Anaerovoracaceae bacterium]PWL93461.1 MAG: 30S ribosome-binding factor RbfA [Clostridiales bacterium]
MGKGYRQGRLGEEIRRIISSMLIHQIKDPRLSSMISISGVDVTADGSYATCYVSVLNMSTDAEKKEQAEKEILAGLASASGMMKKEIGRQVRMRRVPQLIFKMDHSMEYGEHIDKILGTMDFDSYQKDEEEDFEGPEQ